MTSQQQILYGPLLSKINLNGYTRNFHNSVGFGCRPQTSMYMTAAPTAALPKVNAAVNVPDQLSVDDKTTATPFTKNKDNVLAPTATEFLGQGSVIVEDKGGPAFQPCPTSKKELAQVEARKRKMQADMADSNNSSSSSKKTDVNPEVAAQLKRAAAASLAAFGGVQTQAPNSLLLQNTSSAKKPRSRRGPVHRFHIKD